MVQFLNIVEIFEHFRSIDIYERYVALKLRKYYSIMLYEVYVILAWLSSYIIFLEFLIYYGILLRSLKHANF